MSTSPFDQLRPPEPPRGERRRGGRRRRRGGGDPNATVPDAEFVSYYGKNVVQAPPWGWPIASYLFLGGLSAGSGLIGAGSHFTGRTRMRRRSLVTAMTALSAGGVALAGDLGRPERALNMMRTVKLTSPMSVGSWVLAGFGAFTGLALAVDIARPMLARTWLGAGRPATAVAVLDGLASAGSAFFSPPLAAYTAVLLSDTAAPTWHDSYHELPFIFVSSATAAANGMAMITTPPAETVPARQLAVLAVVCDLLANRLMLRRLGELAAPYEEDPKARRWHRAATVLTAAGGVGAALLGGRRWGAVLAGAALVGGSLATRFSVFHAGMTSAKDPRYTVRPQRARARRAAEHGRGITQPGGPWPD